MGIFEDKSKMCQVEDWIFILKVMEKIVAVGNYWKETFFRVMSTDNRTAVCKQYDNYPYA